MLRNSLALSLLFLLGGCNIQNLICAAVTCGAPSAPTDQPGSFSYYAFTQYSPYGNEDNLCATTAPPDTCVYDVQQYLAAPLITAGWSQKNAFSIFAENGQPSVDPTATTLINDTANLIYINTHGGIIDGAANLCLWNCNGSRLGNDYSVGPTIMPAAWNGANWLVLDACGVVQPNVGWEGIFGGSLHGILGYNNNTSGMDIGADTVFTTEIAGYGNTAIGVWEDAVAKDSANSPFLSALIPQANGSDEIEAPGGPHFGSNGDTNPQYYSVNSAGQVTIQSVSHLGVMPSSAYTLVPEQMNETYWYDYYGGGSLPSQTTHPSSNEDLYRNQYAIVDHYLASGGMFFATGATGTAKGFSAAEAYQYALSWIQSNGGLPSDAALTFSGEETVTPTTTAPTSDQPYPSVRQYIFIWRHANSGLLSGDKIEINVDDAGALSIVQTSRQVCGPTAGCHLVTVVERVPPWIPVYQIRSYTRIWRALGAAQPLSGTPTITASSYAYCGSGMAAVPSIAEPCGVVSTASGDTLLDAVSGMMVGSSENM